MRKIIKLSLLLAILFLIAQDVQPQTSPCPNVIGKMYNNWYFGEKLGVTFNTSNATLITNPQMNAIEGCAAVSDVNTGNILFYTNGRYIFNFNNQLINYNNPLNGGYQSSKQSSLIVPRPNMANRYYVFTTPDFTNDALNTSYMYYTEVEASSNGVSIVSNTLNTLLTGEYLSSEKITAACDSTGNFIWIIGHTKDNDTFLFSKINKITGQVTFDHFQKIGHSSYRHGEFKMSPDGKKFACVTPGNGNLVELYDFYSSTGMLGNYRSYQCPAPWTLDFSPNSRYLYVGNAESYYPHLVQFDLTNFPPAPNSATIICNQVPVTGFDGIWGMQLAPDGKIYCCGRSQHQLFVINQPNYAGSACSFQPSLQFNDGRVSYHSLPNIAYLCCSNQSGGFEPCANEVCLVNEINMSTGYGKTPNDVDRDDNWLLIDGPTIAGYDYPRLPFVKEYLAWYEIDNSHWIGIKPGQLSENNPNDPYVFERCFCFCDSAWIKMKLIILADDKISIRFNGQTIYTTPAANDGYAHIRRDTVEINRFVTEGTYCMNVDLYNLHGTITGFNIAGTMTATRNGQPVSVLLTEECCNPRGQICGKKILDVNCNGQIDTSDVGLQGWTIQLMQDNIVYMAATTSADGSYCFNNVPDGEYIIQEVQQDGYEPSVPSSGSAAITLDSLNNMLTYNFLNCLNEDADTICVQKILDVNCNGIFDQGDQPLSGWDFQLMQNGTILQTATTGTNGWACFLGNFEGPYTVEELVQDGYTPSNPTTGTVNIVVDSLKHTITVRFLNCEENPCTDFDEDTSHANWVTDYVTSISVVPQAGYGNSLQLVDGSGPSVAIDNVDFNGDWLTMGVDGCICFDYKVDWNSSVNTTPISAPKLSIYTGSPITTSTGANSVYRAGFKGYSSLPAIGDNVWNHFCLPVSLCVGGQIPSNSYGFWQLVSDDGSPIAASDSCAIWDNLITHVTGIILPTDYNADPSEIVYFDNFCWNCTYQDTICGRKILDLNCNGRQDPNEGGLSGWTFNLIRDTSVIMTTVSGANGEFCFYNVPEGDYIIQEVPQTGYSASNPSSGTISITIDSSHHSQYGLIFLNCKDSTSEQTECCDSAMFEPYVHDDENRSVRTITIFNFKTPVLSPISYVEIKYYDCSNGSQITGALLYQLSGGDLTTVRDLPAYEYQILDNPPNSWIGYPYDRLPKTGAPQPFFPGFGSSNSTFQNRITFNLSLPNEATPIGWCIKLTIHHEDGTICNFDLPQWVPSSDVYNNGQKLVNVLDPPQNKKYYYVATLNVDLKKTKSMQPSLVVLTGGEIVYKIAGGSGGLWEAYGLKDSAQRKSINKFVQTDNAAMFSFNEVCDGVDNDCDGSVDLFLVSDKKDLKPKLKWYLFDRKCNVLASDTFSTVSGITNIGDVEAEMIYKSGMSINSIVPNPTNGFMDVEFYLLKADFIKVELINDIGQLVSQVFDGYKLAGINHLQFNAEGINTGNYLIRIKSPTGVVTSKVSVIK